MIAYTYIEKNLKALDIRYRSPQTSTRDAYFASKLAILELCGWIEESMDDCILRASIRVLGNERNRKLLKDKVRKTHGFEYEHHFMSMMVQLVGLWGFERICKSVDTAVQTRFLNELKILKDRRNALAHTYTRGVTQHYDAPSVTLGRFGNVRAGLQAYDSAIRKYWGIM